jgi:hypothetical protein
MRKRSLYAMIVALTVFPAASWAQATDTLTLSRQQLTDENFKIEAGKTHQSVLDLRKFISGNKEISLVRLFAKAKWGEPYVALRVSSKDKVLSGLTIKTSEDFVSDDERSFFNHELTNFSRGAQEKAELVFVGRVQSLPADQQVIKIHRIEVVFGVPSEIDQVSIALDQAAQDVGAAGDSTKQVQPQIVELGPVPTSVPVPAPVPAPLPVPRPAPAPRSAPEPAPAKEVFRLPDLNNRLVEVQPGDRILLFIQGVAVPVIYVGPSRNPGEVMVRMPNQRDPVSRRLSSLRAERR